MSERPELKDVVIAVRDVVEWYELGLQLGLPDATLAVIAAHPDFNSHRRMMLSTWLQYDTKASWEKLAAALNKMGKNVVAANVRRQFVTPTQPPTTNVESASTAVPLTKKELEEEAKGSADKEAGPLDDAHAQVKQDANKRLAVKETVVGKIKSRFSLLVINVRSAMQRNKVDALDVHQFLVTYFEGECDIPEVSNLTKIFNAMTTTKLWRYDHYGPLANLAESFLPVDDPARGRMSEYKSELTGFQATTQIIDMIELNELEDSEDVPNRLFSPKKYNSHYQKLTVKLRLDRDVSELTLKYVDMLWKALREEFRLPPLTAVIDKIMKGSLRITWLVLPHIIEKIRASYFRSLEFFKRYEIARIDLYYDDLTLYDERWMTGSTPLFRASFAGDVAQVKHLLKEGGADVNAANDNDWGNTPLMGACMTGQAEVAKLLLDHKTDIDHQDKARRSALHHASWYGHPATVMVLLEYEAQVNIVNEVNEGTPLMDTCVLGFTDVARLLLVRGANVDLRDKDGRSALMEASGNGHKETVTLLLQYRARVDLLDNDGWTALAWAIDCGYADTARVLLENGAAMDFEDDIWKSLLQYACEQDFSEAVEVMLEFNAPVNIILDEEDSNTALSVACENGSAATAEVLLKHRAAIDYQNKKGQSALHLASIGGHTKTVAVLIEKGAQLNLQDQDGWTALLFATKQGHLETVQLLLESDAAVHIESKSGLTAVKVAQSEAHQDVCDILLQHIQQGAKVSSTPHQKESESTQKEETEAELAKVGRQLEVHRNPEDTQQNRRGSEKQEKGRTNREQQEANSELTEAQKAEVRSVGEQIWEAVKRALLRERVKKELAGQMRSEQGSSEYIMQPTRQRRSIFNRLLPRRGQRTQRQGRRPDSPCS